MKYGGVFQKNTGFVHFYQTAFQRAKLSNVLIHVMLKG